MAKRNAGVLTSKEMGLEKPKGDGKPSPSSSSLPEAKARGRFRYRAKLPFAPLGESCTTLSYNGELLRIAMTDGIYEFPEDMERGAAEALLTFLTGKEFLNASEFIEGATEPAVPEVPKRLLYVVGHPDNTKETKITATFTVEGFEKPFECIDGVIKTDDESAFKALLAQGFYEVGIRVLEDENPEGK